MPTLRNIAVKRFFSPSNTIRSLVLTRRAGLIMTNAARLQATVAYRLIVISHRNDYDFTNAGHVIPTMPPCYMENIIPACLCWPTRPEEYGR